MDKFIMWSVIVFLTALFLWIAPPPGSYGDECVRIANAIDLAGKCTR